MNDGKRNEGSPAGERSTLEELRRRGSLLRFGSHQAYRHLLQSVAIRTGLDLSQPSTFVIRVTDRCPLRCVHCTDWSADSAGELTTGQWIDILDDIARWPGRCHTILTGGEPLQRDDLDQLARHASRRGLTCTVFTHGGNLGVARLARLVDAGVRCLRVSLDGIGETHSRIRGREKFWERTSRSIETLRRLRRERDLRYTVRLKHVIMAHNLTDTIEVARLANQEGFHVFYQPIEQNYNTPEDPQWFLHNDNWPKDTAQAARNVRELIRLKREGWHIANSYAQLEAMIPYFENPDAHRVAVMSHAAHEARRSCTALVHMQFQANGDVVACSGVPPIGNIKRTPIREIWKNRPRYWESGCCLEKRCSQAELATLDGPSD